MLEAANGIEHERSLVDANTMALPSVAERYWRARSVEDVAWGLALAAQHDWPLTLLGGGSNLLLPARVAGLTLQPDIGGITFHNLGGRADEHVTVTAGAGVVWHHLVQACVERELWGIENLALIPGLVGATPIQNIGAYGVELADVLEWVEVVDRHTGGCRRLERDECELGYRDSLFKRELAGQVVITRLGLSLSWRPRPRLEYGALGERVVEPQSARSVFDAVCAIRREKLPDPAALPNAGSFFKNPIVEVSKAQALLAIYPHMPSYPQADGRVKLAAGWLIEQCGFKGVREGAFGVHERQALVLVHWGGGSLGELLRFATSIAAGVQASFGVSLEREPREVSAEAVG